MPQDIETQRVQSEPQTTEAPPTNPIYHRWAVIKVLAVYQEHKAIALTEAQHQAMLRAILGSVDILGEKI